MTHPSLFNEDGTMTKASPVKVLREETDVSAVPNMSQQNLKTAVVVYAMYLFVAGPSTKTKYSALSQSATETICRLTCRLAQTTYIYVATGTIL